MWLFTGIKMVEHKAILQIGNDLEVGLTADGQLTLVTMTDWIFLDSQQTKELIKFLQTHNA